MRTGQVWADGGRAMIPPPLSVRPEFTDADVAWLNQQLALLDRPGVRYARELPTPPPTPRGARPPAVTGWITTTTIRG